MDVLSEGELLFRHTTVVPAGLRLEAESALTAGFAPLVPKEKAVLSGTPLLAGLCPSNKINDIPKN